MKKTVLGIKIDDITTEEALKEVEGWLKRGGKHYIVTTNPEFIVTAQGDGNFKNILNKADLSIPDGKGLQITGDIECSIPGVDFMEALVKMATVGGFTVGFLGGGPGVAELCTERLIKKYPKLKVGFGKVDILFVAFGHPKQEKWIAKNLPNLDVKVAMGVGGAFDYFSGKVPRAPKFVRDLGFEWLFRLIIQPWRIKRQLMLLKYLFLLTNKGKSV